MNMQWSITDPNQGARTVEEITVKSKLGETNKQRFKPPMFDFIPMDCVVIDSLHLRIFSDVLTNLHYLLFVHSHVAI